MRLNNASAFAGQEVAPPVAHPATRQNYILALLFCMALFYQLDRNLVFVTQELIKAEFGLSDTQLGLVSGFAFGLANGLAGFPMGWLNDRVNRARLLSACIMIWSGMTVACGFATNFMTFFLARFSVGAAEAGGSPLALSLITDLFPPAQRGSKIGIMSAGFALGTAVSALVGAYIAAHLGWRAAFFICGLPGVLLGLLFLFTVKEPERTRTSDELPTPARALPRTIALLLVTPGLRVVFLGTALTSLISGGVLSWWASFMMRAHRLDLPTVGLISTISLGLCALVCTVAAGYVADRARQRTRGGHLIVIAGLALVNLASGLIALWTPSTAVMIAALCVVGGTTTAYLGPRGAILSELAPPHLRGVTFTIPIVISSIVGVAIGGVMVGMLSDFAATAIPGIEPLRVAMSAVLCMHLPVAALYFLTARKMARDDMVAAVGPASTSGSSPDRHHG